MTTVEEQSGHGLRELAEESRATDSGEVALTAWGWTLAEDPKAVVTGDPSPAASPSTRKRATVSAAEPQHSRP